MKCAVGNCKQDSRKKSSGKIIHYFRFPSKPEQLKCWIDFCVRSKPISKHDRICSLHFKNEDFERNFKFEMGLTENYVPKLKPDAVPSVKQLLKEEDFTQLCNDEGPLITEYRDEHTVIDNNAPNLQIQALERQIEALRLKTETLKNVHSQSLNIIKKLRRQIESVNFYNKNLEETLGRIFTKGQVKKIKNGNKRQNWTQADIVQSITLYSTSAKAYKLLRKKKFPLPSVRTLQRWTFKQ